MKILGSFPPPFLISRNSERPLVRQLEDGHCGPFVAEHTGLESIGRDALLCTRIEGRPVGCQCFFLLQITRFQK